MSFLHSLTRVVRAQARSNIFTSAKRKISYTQQSRPFYIRSRLLWAATAAVVSTSAFIFPTIHLDSDTALHLNIQEDTETRTDPATSITFPTTINIPSKIRIPSMTLLGLGVRSVSFLGIKVYSVGFYADLDNPSLKGIPLTVQIDDKIQRIVRNSACVIRIVPVRTTSYTHLRDAFMRAMQTRVALAKQNGTLSEEEAQAIGSSLRKLKSLFPNSPLAKHASLDIYLSTPTPGRPRALVFRGLGAIENDWVATEFFLHYFDGAGPSPPLKKSVADHLESFET